jgi:hypothetical protein
MQKKKSEKGSSVIMDYLKRLTSAILAEVESSRSASTEIETHDETAFQIECRKGGMQ